MVLVTYPEELHKSGPVINNQNKTLDVALSKLLPKPESVRSGSNRVRPLSSRGGGKQGTRHCHVEMPPSGHHSCRDVKYQAQKREGWHEMVRPWPNTSAAKAGLVGDSWAKAQARHVQEVYFITWQTPASRVLCILFRSRQV